MATNLLWTYSYRGRRVFFDQIAGLAELVMTTRFFSGMMTSSIPVAAENVARMRIVA